MKKQIKDRLDKIIGRSGRYDNVWKHYRDCKQQIIEAKINKEIGGTSREYDDCIVYITDKLGI